MKQVNFFDKLVVKTANLAASGPCAGASDNPGRTEDGRSRKRGLNASRGRIALALLALAASLAAEHDLWFWDNTSRLHQSI